MNQDDFVSLKLLAEEMGMDRSHARRYILKHGFKPQKRRTVDAANQLALTVTKEEAETILRLRGEQGFSEQRNVVESETGVFYIIQLVPELDPTRIKLGFANDLNDRISQHRTAAPTAKVLKSWPCKRKWEGTVIDCLSAVACRHILNEVFECHDLEALIRHGDELFHLLPTPSCRVKPSEHSPYKSQ